jgi:hypothetical protein
MQSFLAAFLPVLALMLTPFFIILMSWAVGVTRDAFAPRRPSSARER